MRQRKVSFSQANDRESTLTTSHRTIPRRAALQANEEYRRYMGDWWGDAIKAEWEERKADPL